MKKDLNKLSKLELNKVCFRSIDRKRQQKGKKPREDWIRVARHFPLVLQLPI